MAKITRVTTQKKNKNRFNIYIDRGQGESYGFSVDEDIMIEYMLRKGMELDESLIKTLVEKDNFHKVFTLALNYLSYRMRSEKEIRVYLLDKEVEEEKIAYVIDRLKQEGYLDDQEFANSLVRTRILTSSKGPLLVKKELIEKGISLTMADEALTYYPYEAQLEKASKWVEKKLRMDGKKSFRQQLQSTKQTLLQKGFSQDVIKEVMEEKESDKDENAEWDAVVYNGEKALRKYSSKAEGYELKQKVKGALYRKGFSFELIEHFLDEYIN